MGLLNDGKLLTYIYNHANKTIEFVFREICITIIITLEGFKKIWTKQNDKKTVWTITRACERAKIYLSPPICFF